MSQYDRMRPRKLHLSLLVRVSGLLILVAILPLIVTVTFIELISRPALVTQVSHNMETDAQIHTNLIDNYFSERLLEAEALSRLQPIQSFLAGDTTQEAKALDGLATGHGRGSYYEDWSLFDLQGKLSLYYPTKPQMHGQYYILPNDQRQLLTSQKSLISDVFFNRASNEAYIDIYTPVVTASYKPVGILRTSFDLNYVWQTVDSEASANGSGSYAFILDHNGMRIAYTNPKPDPAGTTQAPDLFKAIAPFSPATRQSAKNTGLYGLHGNNESVLADPTLSKFQQGGTFPTTFQMVPAEQQTTFQVATSRTYTVPWNYFVLSPLSTVTQVADQQLVIAFVITTVMLVLAAVVGLRTGQSITRPILRSVDFLGRSSQALKRLSSKQQSAAEEQTWVVEASRAGLEKVEYYSQATNVAARQLSELGTGLIQNWQYLNERDVIQGLQKIVAAAKYIEKARSYQDDSDKNLASAIRVTTDVTDQLSKGATSAAEAANELEEVVNQLRAVV